MRQTRESEASQYPEEEKATAIPLVVVSERGSSPNSGSGKATPVAPWGLQDDAVRPCGDGGKLPNDDIAEPLAKPLERATGEGDSPVGEMSSSSLALALSSIGPVKSGANPGGPPLKAKYDQLTDSGDSTARER